jgi:hypothetical protein
MQAGIEVIIEIVMYNSAMVLSSITVLNQKGSEYQGRGVGKEKP